MLTDDVIYISYFYQIRNFTKDIIPVSTAMYQPSFFKVYGEPYLDKRGILNGIVFKALSPYKVSPSSICERGCKKNPSTCEFLKEYYEYLSSLPFDSVKSELDIIRNWFSAYLKRDCHICLMVYEKPDNPCSERGPLIRWFKENGVELKEWSK